MDSSEQRGVISLDGRWRFGYARDDILDAHAVADIERAGLRIYPCTVPGNFELDLHSNGIVGDPFFGINIASLRAYEHCHVWYCREFRATPKQDCKPELVFEGIDCIADIYLNGEALGHVDNMLVEHVFDVDGRLREDNEILVHIKPAVLEATKYDYPAGLSALGGGYESLYVRKPPHCYGWDIMPRAVSAGIWRSVEVRYRPVERLERVYLRTVFLASDNGCARLSLHYQATTRPRPDDTYEIEVEGCCGPSEFLRSGRMLFEAGILDFEVKSPKLWWPKDRGEPNLYDVAVALRKNGAEIDRLVLTHGIRTVTLNRTSTTDISGSGEFCFVVNGEKLFIRGTNWVPADAYHSRDIERIPRMLELADDLGCNMIRCWGGNVYEHDLFFRICDAKGIMVWQDFAMACASYPQGPDFQKRLEHEARKVIRRLRQHPSLVLWAGDNEVDMFCMRPGGQRDPNGNELTRRLLPRILRDEDGTRPYIPSSPYVDDEALKLGDDCIDRVPENHLWGARDYFKNRYYSDSLCHLASEIGYHGCPSVESIRKFISEENLWPYERNEEWTLHSTSPVLGVDLYDYRVRLMANQVKEYFGQIPDNLEEFSAASQMCQAEAYKFFIELFRSNKWRRTGIIWWNLIDGWPQFSDAVVDYYFDRKLAYDYIKRSQEPVCLMMREPEDWRQKLVVSNDTRANVRIHYTIHDIDTGELVAEGQKVAVADSVTALTTIAYTASRKRFYLIRWQSQLGAGWNHYTAGNAPFSFVKYGSWLRRVGEWLEIPATGCPRESLPGVGLGMRDVDAIVADDTLFQ